MTLNRSHTMPKSILKRSKNAEERRGVSHVDNRYYICYSEVEHPNIGDSDQDGYGGDLDQSLSKDGNGAPNSNSNSEKVAERQKSLANVMGKLLKKTSNNDNEILSKISNIKNSTGSVEERGKKRKKDVSNNFFEIVDLEGNVQKISTDVKRVKTDSVSKSGQQNHPRIKNRASDPLCQNPLFDADVVKEKRLRTLATKGVVQLFNALEQFRQQQKSGEQSQKTPAKAEISAITAGDKTGLIDFLMKKRSKVALGLPVKNERPLFKEESENTSFS